MWTGYTICMLDIASSAKKVIGNTLIKKIKEWCRVNFPGKTTSGVCNLCHGWKEKEVDCSLAQQEVK